MNRRRRIIIGLAVVVPLLVAGAIAAAIAGGLLLDDKATPVSIRDVLERFHEGEGRTGALDGVYVYTTRGEEYVDALGGTTHRYPKTTTVTVTTVPCGFQLLWEPLRGALGNMDALRDPLRDRAGRVESGSRVLRPVRFHGLYVHGERPRAWRRRLYRERTPLCLDTGSQEGETRVVGVEALAIGDSQLQAVHVRTVGRLSGGDAGTETTDWWLDERSGLPLRIGLSSRTSRSIPLGDVHYREDADLRLARRLRCAETRARIARRSWLSAPVAHWIERRSRVQVTAPPLSSSPPTGLSY